MKQSIFLFFILTLSCAYATAGEDLITNYPDTDEFKADIAGAQARGIVLYDMHIHARGGVTPEAALERELKTGIKSAILSNHGRDWDLNTEEKLLDFIKRARSADIAGKRLLVGVQVNDRDWVAQISPQTRSQLDYILADAMIMPESDGTSTRIWRIEAIENSQEWMLRYFEHNMRILDEPITILANPTYLPPCLAKDYDALWTDERLDALISKAVKNGVVLEVQAESPFQANPRFIRIAKARGAKLSLGTNNRDGRAVSLDTWFKAIELGDLHGEDFWTPPARK